MTGKDWNTKSAAASFIFSAPGQKAILGELRALTSQRLCTPHEPPQAFEYRTKPRRDMSRPKKLVHDLKRTTALANVKKLAP
jgi:hypothetical protein